MVRELVNKNYCVVDIELTEEKEIIQFSAMKLDSKFNEIANINYYIKPIKSTVTSFVTELTGITNDLLEDKEYFKDIAEEIYNFIKDDVLVCHGLQSDYIILKKHFHDVGIHYHPAISLDTVELARLFMPTQASYRLSDLSSSLKLYAGDGYHNAAVDVDVTVKLLREIVLKISFIDPTNYKVISELLEKIDNSIFMFSNYCRSIHIEKEENEEKYITYDGVKFKKITIEDNNVKKGGKILFASINPQDYVEKFNIKNYVILKKKSKYVPLNIFSLLPKKEDLNLDRLLVKLYVWILETDSGDLTELNLLYLEEMYLVELENKFKISSETYYFDKKNKQAQMSENIITNYDNIEYLLESDVFSKYTFVFENKKILGRELDSKNTQDFHYKAVITELNIAISQNPNDKKLKTIRTNVDSLIKFLHEMYVSESLFLYKDSLDFILQDIEVILEGIRKCHLRLPTTYNFNKKLIKVLSNKKNSYKFELLDQETTLVLTVVNDRKVKDFINLIHSRPHKYLNIKTRVPFIYTKDEQELISSRYQGTVLFVFESSKYKDLYFSKKERRAHIKYNNFSLKDSFNSLYNDVLKNNRYSYRCYATKDILDYKYYLKDVFDNIVILREIEF